MDLATFERINSSEWSARAYMLERNDHSSTSCPRCAALKPYQLADGRMRCTRCRFTFHLLTGRWLNQGAFSLQQWMRAVKLFELDVAAGTAAAQLGVTYKTAHRAFTTVRRAIASRSPDAVTLLTGAPGAVFGYRREGVAMLLRTLGPDEAAGIAAARPASVAAGPLALTGPYGRWQGLIAVRQHLAELSPHERASGFAAGGGFREYVIERVRRYRGISRPHVPLYLMEMELRYNMRDGDLFGAVAACMRVHVPRPTEGHAAS